MRDIFDRMAGKSSSSDRYIEVYDTFGRLADELDVLGREIEELSDRIENELRRGTVEAKVAEKGVAGKEGLPYDENCPLGVLVLQELVEGRHFHRPVYTYLYQGLRSNKCSGNHLRPVTGRQGALTHRSYHRINISARSPKALRSRQRSPLMRMSTATFTTSQSNKQR